jgi:uncharacterized protein YpuA (DUF1002 family)
MHPTTETDIQELKNLVLGLREEMRIGFTEIKGDIKSLDQRVSSLDERLKTQDGKFWTLVTIILGTASTLLIKILGFPNT